MKTTFPSTILIVDDDEINIYIAIKLIKKISPNISVKSFNNGIDAVSYLRSLLVNDEPFPSYIFLDLNMQPMDGWQFLDELHLFGMKYYPCVVILTSSIFKHDIGRAEAHVIDNHFISKPLTSEHLLKVFS